MPNDNQPTAVDEMNTVEYWDQYTKGSLSVMCAHYAAQTAAAKGVVEELVVASNQLLIHLAANFKDNNSCWVQDMQAALKRARQFTGNGVKFYSPDAPDNGWKAEESPATPINDRKE